MEKVIKHSKEAKAAWEYIKEEMLRSMKHNDGLTNKMPDVLGLGGIDNEKVSAKGLRILEAFVTLNKKHEIYEVILKESDSFPEFLLLYDTNSRMIEKLEKKPELLMALLLKAKMEK